MAMVSDNLALDGLFGKAGAISNGSAVMLDTMLEIFLFQ